MQWPHVAMLCASLVCMSSAYAARFTPPLLGLFSLPALMAAFAGAGLILSFLPPRETTHLKLFGTIVFCALLGALGAPASVQVAAGYVSAFSGPGAEIVTAFIVGAIGQVCIPMLIERRAELLARFLPLQGRKPE